MIVPQYLHSVPCLIESLSEDEAETQEKLRREVDGRLAILGLDQDKDAPLPS